MNEVELVEYLITQDGVFPLSRCLSRCLLRCLGLVVRRKKSLKLSERSGKGFNVTAKIFHDVWWMWFA